MTRIPIGMQIGASTPPSDLGAIAAEVETLGFGELWLAEDYFESGGFASSAVALASTAQIPVGLGVVAAGVRHPAVAAMEIATLATSSGHRFMAGLGHGSPGWVRQMGLWPESPMGLLREATIMTRRLLGGEEVTEDGTYFRASDIRLAQSPARHVPLYLGVHGPASLRLSGELADGTLLGWFSSPGYVKWARTRIDEGRDQAGVRTPHELVTLCLLSISDDDPDGAERDMADWSAPMLRAMARSAQMDPAVTGIEPAFSEETAEGNPFGHELSSFAAVGSTQSCLDTVRRLMSAGADRVVLVPNPAGRLSTEGMIGQMRRASALLAR